MSEFDREHDPNGDGQIPILIGIALLWLVLSVVGALATVIWWIVS